MKTRLLVLTPLLFVGCKKIGVVFPIDTGTGPSTDTTDSTAPTGDSSGGHSADTVDSGDSGETSPCAKKHPFSTIPVPDTWSWGADMTVADAGASFVGELPDDASGSTILTPGDLDGDGFADFLVGAYNSSELTKEGGKVYVVWGREKGWALGESLSGKASFVGEEARQQLSQVFMVGDTDGDCRADFTMSPGYSNMDYYGVYFVRGRAREDWGSSVPVHEVDAVITSVDGSTGFDSWSDPIGDQDGDGLDDILVQDQASHGGEAFVVSGAEIARAASVPDDAMLWVYGTDAAVRDTMDTAVAGDLTGDGLSDMIFEPMVVVGKEGGGSDFYHNVAYLLFADPSALPLRERIDEAADVVITAEPDQYLRVDAVGDVNGDGLQDILAAVTYGRDPSRIAGYLFFGRETWPASLSLSEADVVVNPGLALYPSVVGDLDGDGFDDLALVQIDGDTSATSLYVFLGRTTWPGTLSLSERDFNVVLGPGNTHLDVSGSAHHRGDINGDGIEDLIVRSQGFDTGVTHGGIVAVFLGRSTWPSELTERDADVRFLGTVAYQSFGEDSWFTIGDLNHDGYDDLVSSYPAGGTDSSGETFVFFGKAGP